MKIIIKYNQFKLYRRIIYLGAKKMGYIGYVGVDIQFARLKQADLDRGLVFIEMYDLPYTDLSAYEGIIITNYVDEQFMMDNRKYLENYLAQGGVVFSFAEMSMSWLPNAPIWKRSSIAIKDREIILSEPIHPMFAGVDTYDLNYRRGVKGFFTRGYFEELPEGAEVIVKDETNAPIIYIDRKSTNGTLIVGSGTDIYQVYRYEESSAARLATQILEAMRVEFHKRKGAAQ